MCFLKIIHFRPRHFFIFFYFYSHLISGVVPEKLERIPEQLLSVQFGPFNVKPNDTMLMSQVRGAVQKLAFFADMSLRGGGGEAKALLKCKFYV